MGLTNVRHIIFDIPIHNTQSQRVSSVRVSSTCDTAHAAVRLSARVGNLDLRKSNENSQIRFATRAHAAAVHASVPDLDVRTAEVVGCAHVKERVAQSSTRSSCGRVARSRSSAFGASVHRLTVRAAAGRAGSTPLCLHSSWWPLRSLSRSRRHTRSKGSCKSLISAPRDAREPSKRRYHPRLPPTRYARAD